MRRIFLAMLALTAVGLSAAEPGPPPTCFSCQTTISARYHWADSIAFLQRQAICDACKSTETRCYECGLPTKVGFTKFKDGRIACPPHAQSALFSQRQAQSVFRDAQRTVIQLLRDQGRLPDNNIEVQLVDQQQMRDLLNRPAEEAAKVRGVTQSSLGPTGRFSHRVFLLNGLTPQHTLAVAAHEYTHAWIAENVTRTLNDNTIEGFCELVAFKVVSHLNLAVEQKTIRANAYSQGQLDSLLKTAEDFRFYQVVAWIKAGKDESIDANKTENVFALSQPNAAPFVLPTSTPTKVPDKLTLKGISGTAKRRFALVNDRTLEKNEVNSVRVGNSSVEVRCLEITANTVLLELVDSRKQVRLTLREKQ